MNREFIVRPLARMDVLEAIEWYSERSREIGTEFVRVLDAAFEYLIAGLLGSTAVGLLLPVARWTLGRIALGMLTGTLIYGAVSWSMDGSVDHFVALVAGIPVGGLLGWYWPKLWSA